jgi:LysM repeat protein
MKKILLLVLIGLGAVVAGARAQDAALLEERVKRMSGEVQDLQEANASLKKQVAELIREIAALREQQSGQSSVTPASNDDLRDLARKVQEIERKREADREYLEGEFNRLAKLIKNSAAVTPNPNANPGPELPKDGREHTVTAGDTLSTIAAAYARETGRKVTVDLILKANPGLNPSKLKIGQKIVVPIP